MLTYHDVGWRMLTYADVCSTGAQQQYLADMQERVHMLRASGARGLGLQQQRTDTPDSAYVSTRQHTSAYARGLGLQQQRTDTPDSAASNAAAAGSSSYCSSRQQQQQRTDTPDSAYVSTHEQQAEGKMAQREGDILSRLGAALERRTDQRESLTPGALSAMKQQRSARQHTSAYARGLGLQQQRTDTPDSASSSIAAQRSASCAQRSVYPTGMALKPNITPIKVKIVGQDKTPVTGWPGVSKSNQFKLRMDLEYVED
jgi:hypothetical protein